MKLNIYEHKYQWKIILIVVALFIIALSLFYTNILARQLAQEERKRIELFARGLQEVNNVNSNIDVDFLSTLVTTNTTIPVILIDEAKKITGYRNINGIPANITSPQDSVVLKKALQVMQNGYPPIEIDLAKYENSIVDSLGNVIEDSLTTSEAIANHSTNKQYVYYNDSTVLVQLRMYPVIQFFIIGLFLVIAYTAFSSARRSEQNKVWLGMAKETAHQLGTPLSSLVAWGELLKQIEDDTGQAEMIGTEIDKDINRLQLIADRFSKIGSKPKLFETNLVENVEKTMLYIKRLASEKINFTFETSQPHINAYISPTLFDWVIENLLKNALDAMERTGSIKINIKKELNSAVIEVTDTGKGIPKSKFSTIFEPGYSTKQRGWGLGLSLSKRIIEQYHKGKIFVSHSTVGKGTTFKIIMPTV